MYLAQMSIDLDVFIVAVRHEPDQRVGPNEAAEPAPEGATGRELLRLVDDHPGEIAAFLKQASEAIQHLVVSHPAGPRTNYCLGRREERSFDDRFESAFGADPCLRRVPNAFLLQFERDPVPDIAAD